MGILQEFALFILSQGVDGFSSRHHEIIRDMDIPLYDRFRHLPEDKQILLSRQYQHRLLSAVAEGTGEAWFREQLNLWFRDEIPAVRTAEVLPGELVMLLSAQHRTMCGYIESFTNDLKTALSLTAELEALFTRVTGMACQLQCRLTEKHRLEADDMALALKKARNVMTEYTYVTTSVLVKPLESIRHIISHQNDECRKPVLAELQKAEQMISLLNEHAGLDIDKHPAKLIDLNTILNDVIHRLKPEIQAKKAEINTSVMPEVFGAPALISSVFYHLIKNSINFSGERKPVVEISYSVSNAYFEFSVTDNGVGIDEAYKNAVFVLFQKAGHETGGIGAGLAFCRKIVELHGGKIWLQSIPGEGSTFSFTIKK